MAECRIHVTGAWVHQRHVATLVDPDTEQARTWLREELAKPTYTKPGLWERFQEWLMDLLSRMSGSGAVPGWVVPVVVLVVLAALGLVLWRVLRREPVRTAERTSGAVLDGVTSTPAELRASARAALTRGDADAALLDAYRAIVSGSVERTILDDRPGRTAHEAARELTSAFPGSGAGLASAADDFDAVRYGHLHTTSERATAVIELDDQLRSATPQLAGALPW